MELTRAVGENLKRIRKSKKLSMERLAAEAGVSRSMLGQIERGEANPSVGLLGKLARGIKGPGGGAAGERRLRAAAAPAGAGQQGRPAGWGQGAAAALAAL